MRFQLDTFKVYGIDPMPGIRDVGNSGYISTSKLVAGGVGDSFGMTVSNKKITETKNTSSTLFWLPSLQPKLTSETETETTSEPKKGHFLQVDKITTSKSVEGKPNEGKVDTSYFIKTSLSSNENGTYIYQNGSYSAEVEIPAKTSVSNGWITVTYDNTAGAFGPMVIVLSESVMVPPGEGEDVSAPDTLYYTIQIPQSGQPTWIKANAAVIENGFYFADAGSGGGEAFAGSLSSASIKTAAKPQIVSESYEHTDEELEKTNGAFYYISPTPAYTISFDKFKSVAQGIYDVLNLEGTRKYDELMCYWSTHTNAVAVDDVTTNDKAYIATRRNGGVAYSIKSDNFLAGSSSGWNASKIYDALLIDNPSYLERSRAPKDKMETDPDTGAMTMKADPRWAQTSIKAPLTNRGTAPSGYKWEPMELWVEPQPSSSKEGCVADGTLITLADGTQKKVEDFDGTETVLVWNFMTGSYDTAPLVGVVNHGSYNNITNLRFHDGTALKVIYRHELWDYSAGRYVTLTEENAADYIGHWFVSQNGPIQLTDVEYTQEYSNSWAPLVAGHMACYTNGVLSTVSPVQWLVNTFDVNPETMQYDMEKMAADIEKYGLQTYEEWCEFFPIPYEWYVAFRGDYVPIAVGKGYVTYEEIAELLTVYGEFFARKSAA
jgi:hypothetical protein